MSDVSYHIRQALEILVAPTSRTGSDDCACDVCVAKRRETRFRVIEQLAKAMGELSVN